MTVRRLHAPHLPAEGGTVTLSESASRHVRVLRLRPGSDVELFDGHGRVAAARIDSVRETVVCEADRPQKAELPATRIVLLLSVAKGSKLGLCVRMATELGVDEVALLQAERSVPHWAPARAGSKLDRLTRIAAESAAQCERADVPAVHAPRSATAWFPDIPNEAGRVVFGARAERRFELSGRAPEQIWCAIGPEGGFSDAELRAFQAAGFAVASLGPTILRVDTAVAAALAIVRDRLFFLQPR